MGVPRSEQLASVSRTRILLSNRECSLLSLESDEQGYIECGWARSTWVVVSLQDAKNCYRIASLGLAGELFEQGNRPVTVLPMGSQ